MTGKDVEQRHEEQLKGSSDKGGIKGYLLHRAKPYLPPWLGVGSLGISGTVGHLVWSGDAAMGIGLTLGSVALTGAAWWAGKGVGPQRRLHSAITVAAGSVWFTSASIFDPSYNALFVGGTVTALTWNIRQIYRRDPDGVKAVTDGAGLLEKVGLAKALMQRAKVEPNRVTVPLLLEAGEQTNDDVSKALPRIASALDIPVTAVRYLPDPDSARRGELVVVPLDMLADTVRWEEAGPSLPGGSMEDPLVLGVYDDGQPLMMWFPGDREAGRNATHLLIAGMTGSGKGDGALNLLTEILSRKDVIVWLSDPKGFQDFRPLLPGIDWAVEGGAPTEAMVEAVLAAIPARTAWLGAHRYRQWEAICADEQTDPAHSCRTDGTACHCPGVPFLVSWFEEAGVSLSMLGDDAFNNIANLARSAGIALVVSLQRPSHDQISTTTRDALGSRLCFGVPNAMAASFMLPDTVIDAGAAPERWANRRPGYNYLVTPGVDEMRYSSPGRTRWFTDSALSLMEAVASWAARNGAKPDPVTAGAAASAVGKAYTERARHQEENPEEGDDDEETTVSRLDDEDLDIDPNEELPPPAPGEENVVFGQPDGADLTREEARTVLQDILAEFEADGTMVIGVVDVMAHGERLGRKRGWVSGELQQLLEDGRLTVTTKPGRYRIVPAMADA
ncbi:plasmid transfer protein TraB [Streptomyces sp. H27-H1]|uniref:plasmid transfer protein TraB n=1 Tax=Streptomyces sp. H27-H1 TaxID=2996461 RepID=UPI00226F2845|nr:plasmid transfer protein TraB [Streptomyces sp. H27-H1]MCY0931180.1 plasmid transfer protein TraB [Streptomyces sp. H27-H1]